MDPSFLPAWRLAELTRGGAIGCAELLEHYLARVARLDARLNAVVVTDLPRARARAKHLDSLPRDAAGPLFGVPMTVKESFDVKDLPTTRGHADQRDHRAPADALLVARLEQAGAVVFGKTNVPVDLGDWQSYNALYGTTSNPWNLAHTPGGSSGGSAAALAAGLGGLELGSDIGGSIRVPAHFCGLFGHKSTWGLLPATGFAPSDAGAMVDIAVSGPLARSARDLALALDVLAGPDPAETGLTLNLPAPRATRLDALRVAVWAEQPGHATEAETVALLGALADRLEAEGARVSRTARPEFDADDAFQLYGTLLGATFAARRPEAALIAMQAAKAQLRPDDRSADAAITRAADLSFREWYALNQRRHAIRRAWSAFFRDWDVLLCPAFGTAALPHMQDGQTWERQVGVDGRSVPYNDLLFWAGLTCGYHLPASVAPLGLSRAGLPIGVQIAGPIYGDRTTIAVAGLLEAAWRGFTPPPGWN